MKKQTKSLQNKLKKQSKNKTKTNLLSFNFILAIKNSFKLRKKSWLFFIVKIKKHLHIRKRSISRVKKTKIHSRKVGKFRKLILPLYFGWELRVFISLNRIENWNKQIVGPFKSYWQYITAVVVLIVFASTSIFIYQSNLTQAATFNFTQTNWSGGATANTANHTSNITGWDEYISKDSNISAGTEIVIAEAITNLTETSATDFNTGATSTTDIYGSGDSGYVGLEGVENAGYPGKGLYGITFDSSTNSIWVANYSNDTVTKLSATDGSLLGTYTVGDGPQGITFDSSTSSIWVVNVISGNVTKLSAADGSLLGIYGVGNQPRAIAFDSSTNSIWVANTSDNTVTKLSATDGSTTGTYDVGDGPQGITFDSSTNSVWVVNYTSDNVTKLSATDGSLLGTYSTGSSPRGITFDSFTNSIWVGNYSSSNNIIKLSATDGSLLGTYSAGRYPAAITFDPSTSFIWAASGVYGELSKLSAADGSLINTYSFNLEPNVMTFDSSTNSIWVVSSDNNVISKFSAADGSSQNVEAILDYDVYDAANNAYDITFDSSTNSIWVINYSSDNVMKLSATDGSILGTYDVGDAPYGITLDSSTNSIWAANYNDDTVTKLSATDGSLLGTYAVGDMPYDITFDSSTNSIWVANSNDDTVTKLSATDGSLLGTYAVGDGPQGITFDSSTNSIWVGNRGSNTITKLSAIDGSLLDTYPLNSPEFITFDSSTNSIWVGISSNISYKLDTDGSILNTYSVYSGRGVIFDSSGNYIWAIQSNTIEKFSLVDNSTLDYYPVGDSPRAITFDSSTNSIWVANGNGSSDNIFRFHIYSYPSSGTFTSQILDITNTSFANSSWTSTEPTDTTLTMKVRSDSNSDMSGATAWASCSTITSGADITSNGCVTDAHQYIQYQASLTSSDPLVTPQFQDISIGYNSYTNGSLLASFFDTESSANIMGSISWTESGTGDVQLQVRTAPDSGGSPDWTSGSAWCGPSNCAATAGDTDYASSYYTSSGTSLNSTQSTGDDDQWYQYRLWLTSADGATTPTFSDLNIVYVVNAPPEFENTITATQASDGLVTIDYSIRDTDADSGSNEATPSFQYSINNGDDWNNITSGLSSGATTTITGIDQVTYSSQQATWTPTDQINSYTTTAKIRVIVDDGEGANNTASSDSIAFTMDAKAPTLGGSAIYVVASTTPASIFLDASDDTALEMCITLDNTESNCVTYDSTSTVSLDTDPDTAYVIYKDAYSNTISDNAITPETPINMIIRDLSNVSLASTTPEYRLFVSWAVVSTHVDDFANYEVWHSTDGSSYSLLTSIGDRAVNYYLHDSLTADSTHYYKVYTTDNDGSTSYFSTIVDDVANGQGGTDASPPSISSVATSSIGTQSAIITWTTDELSDSTVGHSTTAANFDDETGVASMVTSHSVTLTGLTPNTTYYYQIQSSDPDTNEATDNNGGDGYSFTTLDGPAISNTGASIVQNTSATITWNTDIASDSTVYYSTNSDMSGAFSTSDSDSVTEHLVTISDLTVGTRYYFYVTSGVGVDNNGGDYYFFNTTSDSTEPVITDVGESIVTDDDAVIIWTTDEGATSQVAYGLAEDTYDTYTTPTSIYSTSHSVTITPLTNITPYYYRVISADSAGNVATSTEHTFTTLEQLTEESDVVVREEVATADGAATVSCSSGGGSSRDRTAPRLSNVVVDSSDSGVNISWDSNENGISIINYGIELLDENTIGDPQTLILPNRKHSINITSLIPNVTYKYEAIVIDSGGNVGRSEEGTFDSGGFSLNIGEVGKNGEVEKSGEVTQEVVSNGVNSTVDKVAEYFKKISTEVSITAAKDGAIQLVNDISNIIPPPIISGEPLLTISSNSASISWTTDDEANALVSHATEEYYLANDDYEHTIGNPDLYLTGIHKVDITGLDSETIYHYRIKSQNRVGSTSQSKDFTFTTIPELAEIENYTTEIVSPEEVVFKWITTVPTDSNLKYTPYRDGKLDIDNTRIESNDIFTTIHNIRAENLEAGVLYQVELYGDTVSGNTINQIIASFATSDDNLAPIIKQVKTDAALSFGKETKVQAIISWYTNEASTSRVYYEQGAGRADEELTKSSPIDENFARHHVVVITNFVPGSIYRFQVESTDGEGNASRSRTYTILTPKQQESVFQVIMKNVETSFGWLQAFR